MKLYYEHAGITIYHGDCREVLPQVEHAYFSGEMPRMLPSGASCEDS